MKRLIILKTSDYTITPELSYYDSKTRVKFSGSCLKQDKVSHSHGKIVNIYLVYEISKNYSISSYPTLENCLFGAISLTKHGDIDQYKYHGYGVRLSGKGESSFGEGYRRNCIIFGADLTNSSHANNRTNNILALGKDFTKE